MPPQRAQRGFSLVELVIVVVIMGIVAATAVARFGELALRAKITSTREAVRAIQSSVDGEQGTTGQWPSVITSVMFVGDRWPRNPLLPSQDWVFDTESSTAQHPSNMVALDKDDGAFWYNTRLGIVRARVPRMSSSAETVALYNLVNGTNASALGEVKPGSPQGKAGSQQITVAVGVD